MKKDIKYLTDIARLYGVSVRFVKNSDQCYYHLDSRIIYIGTSNSKRIFSSFFHELAHYICQQEDRFAIYHNSQSMSILLYNLGAIEVAKYALEAERYVDRLGAQLMRNFYPKRKFQFTYDNKYAIHYLHGFYSALALGGKDD